MFETTNQYWYHVYQHVIRKDPIILPSDYLTVRHGSHGP